MLPALFAPLADQSLFFNLFRYLTFRTGAAMMTALVLAFVIGPWLIRALKARQGAGQPIREDGPEGHFKKRGTPTMGGLMILIAIVVSTILWADLRNTFVWITLLVTIGFGLVGFGDDYLKLTKRNPKGLSGKLKLLVQGAIALVAVVWYLQVTPETSGTAVAIPFLKDVMIEMSFVFIPFAMLVMVGSSNAVNLTDGLDGLATMPIIIAAASFGLIAYLTGNVKFAEYLQIHHAPGAGELAVFCGALIGGALGFLWFNAPPAMVFMGDTGSLSLGGALGAIAMITKHEIVLAIIGGLFVLEAVSVMVQVASFKMTGKRVFRMAPLHHHYEKKGWAEPTIVIRFWIIAVILALIGLSSLKLR